MYVTLLVVYLAGSVQQAAAAMNANVAASPLLAFAWMPWRDDNGVWQKPAEPTPDFAKMTLMDLPPPELYLQAALASPYPVPQVCTHIFGGVIHHRIIPLRYIGGLLNSALAMYATGTMSVTTYQVVLVSACI